MATTERLDQSALRGLRLRRLSPRLHSPKASPGEPQVRFQPWWERGGFTEVYPPGAERELLRFIQGLYPLPKKSLRLPRDAERARIFARNWCWRKPAPGHTLAKWSRRHSRRLRSLPGLFTWPQPPFTPNPALVAQVSRALDAGQPTAENMARFSRFPAPFALPRPSFSAPASPKPSPALDSAGERSGPLVFALENRRPRQASSPKPRKACPTPELSGGKPSFFSDELLTLAFQVPDTPRLSRLSRLLALPGRPGPLLGDLPLGRDLLAAPGLGRSSRRRRVGELPAALEGSALVALLASRAPAPETSVFSEELFLAKARSLNHKISSWYRLRRHRQRGASERTLAAELTQTQNLAPAPPHRGRRRRRRQRHLRRRVHCWAKLLRQPRRLTLVGNFAGSSAAEPGIRRNFRRPALPRRRRRLWLGVRPKNLWKAARHIKRLRTKPMKTRLRRNRGLRQWPWKRLPGDRHRERRPGAGEFFPLTQHSFSLRALYHQGVHRLWNPREKSYLQHQDIGRLWAWALGNHGHPYCVMLRLDGLLNRENTEHHRRQLRRRWAAEEAWRPKNFTHPGESVAECLPSRTEPTLGLLHPRGSPAFSVGSRGLVLSSAVSPEPRRLLFLDSTARLREEKRGRFRGRRGTFRRLLRCARHADYGAPAGRLLRGSANYQRPAAAFCRQDQGDMPANWTQDLLPQRTCPLSLFSRLRTPDGQSSRGWSLGFSTTARSRSALRAPRGYGRGKDHWPHSLEPQIWYDLPRPFTRRPQPLEWSMGYYLDRQGYSTHSSEEFRDYWASKVYPGEKVPLPDWRPASSLRQDWHRWQLGGSGEPRRSLAPGRGAPGDQRGQLTQNFRGSGPAPSRWPRAPRRSSESLLFLLAGHSAALGKRLPRGLASSWVEAISVKRSEPLYKESLAATQALSLRWREELHCAENSLRCSDPFPPRHRPFPAPGPLLRHPSRGAFSFPPPRSLSLFFSPPKNPFPWPRAFSCAPPFSSPALPGVRCATSPTTTW